ncbi:hypothetical protein [Phocaeicola plebeius]
MTLHPTKYAEELVKKMNKVGAFLVIASY